MKKKKPRNSSESGGLVQRILPQRLKVFSLTIGEGALELITNLLAMVLVERAYSQAGLGIYSYLLSFFLIGGYIAEFGVPRYVERETALHHDNEQKQAEGIAEAKGIRQMNRALTGSGGETLVKLKIAEGLQGKKITLLPVSEGGMNLKTTDIYQLIDVMGIKALASPKRQGRR